MEAVRWAEPLPYRGFENAFQHEISIVFQAASIEDRQALAAMQAATRRANEENAESDRQWATPRRPQQLDDYRRRCVFHLSWNVPRVALQPPTSATITVDRSGRVVNVARTGGEALDDRSIAALHATSPCEPVPAGLLIGADTLDVGPGRLR
ncbi:MAG: hypothetical protein ABWX93_11105 [Pseudoxanthomonas sp.]